MGQVTIYLDDESERKLKEAARADGVPVSRWVAETIRRRTRAEWPDSVRRLPGSWDDMERPATSGRDVERESL